MTAKTEQLPHSEGFIVSEANGHLSREEVTITGAAILYPGTVMGVRDDGKYQQLDTGSSEGNDTARAILCSEVDPTEGDVQGVVIERLAEVRESDLQWPAGISTANQNLAIAALLTHDIKVRTAPTTVTTQTT